MFDLYVVTDRELSKGRSDAEVARMAYEGGADVVQLRMKNADGREMLEQANLIRRYADEMCKLFIVDDRVDIAMASGADGVHLGQSDMPLEAARKLMGDDAIIGISVDNVEEVLYKAGYSCRQKEGNRSSTWILLDYGDMIVHVFSKEDRLFYDLERIWRDGKLLESVAELEAEE